MHPGRDVFKQKGPVDGRVPPSPMCSWEPAEGYGEREVPGQGWEPPAGQIRGAGIWLQLWALGQAELGAGQGASR